MDIKLWWRQFTCPHHWKVEYWHWSHGLNGMMPREIEVEMKCQICGKVSYVYPERGSYEERRITEIYQDKQR